MNTTLADIDPGIEAEATPVAARDKERAFKPSLPNAATIAAMEDADAGRVTRAADIDDLFRQLNAGT